MQIMPRPKQALRLSIHITLPSAAAAFTSSRAGRLLLYELESAEEQAIYSTSRPSERYFVNTSLYSSVVICAVCIRTPFRIRS